MISIRLLMALIFLPIILLSQEYPQDYFRSPLQIPLYLSGTFGEIRGNHFHSGIDIKTQQRTGLKVVAAAEGQIVRIKVSPYGFGNALYLQHPNGYTTVYAHLQRFSDEIAEYVREQQYQREKFAVNLFPPAGMFGYQKGEVIGFTGNSGGSGGPHLHFEVRNTANENIINPLLFGFEVADTRSPDIYHLEVYEFHEGELVASQTKDLLARGNGHYSLSGSNIVETNHLPAFGITTFDRQNGYPNKNGAYSIKLCVGDQVVYNYQMETFAFAETRYVNSHIDYAQKKCCRRTINKLYLDPHNQFSAYLNTKKMNFPKLVKDSLYDVEITVSDVAGNESKLNFELLYQPKPGFKVPEPAAAVFRADQANYFKEEDVQFSLPQGALYRNVYFDYERKEACDDCLSAVHRLASNEIPVHRYYNIKIKPGQTTGIPRNKMAIASIEDGRVLDYEGSKRDGDFIVGRTRQLGEFAVVADTIAPDVKAVNFSNGSSFSKSAELRVYVEDNFSGIDTYRAEVNGKWVLFDYDAKNDVLIGRVEYWPIESGTHELQVMVSDELNNTSVEKYQITF